MFKKISIILFFAATVGARHAVPLQGLAFADSYTQDGKPCPPECVSDSMEIETYYPSPYGYYEELRGDKIIVGDSDNSYINETDLPPTGTITFEPKSSAQITTEGTLYEGTVYYDSFDHEFKYYDEASTWQPLGGGGGDYWKPSTASGGSDNIYYTQSGNVGIGVGESDPIGAKLQINMSKSESALILRSIGVASVNSSIGSSQSYKVPSGVTKLMITAYGGQGGGSMGGLGGMAKAFVTVTPEETLYINIGYGGGSSGSTGNPGKSGGGASDVRRGGNNIANRIIVAGGGGGSGGYDSSGNGGIGGAGGSGGGSAGANGSGPSPGIGGDGGLDSRGGSGGSGGWESGISGSSGAGGNGGSGYQEGTISLWSGAGGGGGGGGGGGYSAGGGGGGGSSYVINTATDVSIQNGVNGGAGKVIIEPFFAATTSTTSNNLMEWQNESGSAMSIIDASGNLALGSSTANNYKLYVNGSAYVTAGVWAASDLRFKENILPLDNSLDKILNIQPISFDWNKNGYPDMNFAPSRQIGLVAQEVEKQIPELVHTDSNGYKAVAYDKLTAVLVEAVKEQQAQMRNQQKKIEILELKLKELDEKR